jgi:hypothetical protein
MSGAEEEAEAHAHREAGEAVGCTCVACAAGSVALCLHQQIGGAVLCEQMIQLTGHGPSSSM